VPVKTNRSGVSKKYMELNPVRAAMVGHPTDYQWSSYSFNGAG